MQNNFYNIKWGYLLILILGIGIGAFFTLHFKEPKAYAKHIRLISRGVSFEVVSNSPDIMGLLNEQGLATEQAVVVPDSDTPLVTGMQIDYRAPVHVKIIDGGVTQNVISSALTVKEALDANLITLFPKDEITPTLNSLISEGTKINIQRITEYQETLKEDISYTTEVQGDYDLLYGKEITMTAGAVGKKEVTYLVKTKNGKEISRKMTASVVLVSPTAAIKRVGRKIVIESHEEGRGSWYAYKKCLCAAHAYFPKGSYLRVTNLANGKNVIVMVNDWGPDQNVHPDRVIDLDAEAFKLLAPLLQGTINVRVEKIKTVE